MVLSNFPPSQGVFCGEELLETAWGSGASPAPGEVCVGLRPDEAEDLDSSRDLESGDSETRAGHCDLSEATRFSSLTGLCVPASTSPDKESLRSLTSASSPNRLFITVS